jgi:predicted MFS family arabinose efflux permease
MKVTEGYNSRLYALMFVATLFVLNSRLTQPIFSLFLTSKGINVIQLGILLSVQNFIPLVLRIPMSSLIEKIGRIRSMIISLFIGGVGTLMFLFAKGYTQLLLVVVFNSLSASSFNQTAMSTVSDASPQSRQGDAMGRYLTFLGFGMLLGPALCTILIEPIGYEGLFWVAGLVPVIGILLLIFMAPTNIRERDTSERTVVGARESVGKILSNKNVLLLSYCRASFSSVQSIFLALFSIYLVNQLGYSESTVALLFTVRGLANTLSRYPAGSISDKIGRKPLMYSAYALLVISFVLMSFTKNFYLLTFAMGLYGLCWGTRAVAEWAFLTDLVEPEIKTISISYLASVFSLGSTVGSMASGLLITIFPYSTIFLIGATIHISAIPAIYLMKKHP